MNKQTHLPEPLVAAAVFSNGASLFNQVNSRIHKAPLQLKRDVYTDYSIANNQKIEALVCFPGCLSACPQFFKMFFRLQTPGTLGFYHDMLHWPKLFLCPT